MCYTVTLADDVFDSRWNHVMVLRWIIAANVAYIVPMESGNGKGSPAVELMYQSDNNNVELY